MLAVRVGVTTDQPIHPSAVFEEGVIVEPGAVIGPEASIGTGTIIAAGTIIGYRVHVGRDCYIGPNATITNALVGNRVIVHAGVSIGQDGFGFAMGRGGHLKVPQIGRVIIQDDVEIGANTTIDRGALGDTVVEDDVKLDNQIQIGHNCRIGAHTAIAGCVGIAGSTRIGRNCKIGGAAMIAGHLDIAEGTIISASTGVYDSIMEPGVYTSTFPALPHREWRHVASIVRRLRTLVERVRALEQHRGREGDGS
jgi:UDP-3-O-[3-hydroxymyristoyl] glucosamine N-acyltransferase